MTNQPTFSEEPTLPVADFLELVQRVWPGSYSPAATAGALARTINLTARTQGRLVGCARILADGYFFSTLTEILVAPDYQRSGIGAELMRRAHDASPCTLSFGAQPQNEGFFEHLGYARTMNFFQKRKPRQSGVQ